MFVGFDLGNQFTDSVSGTSTTTIPVGTTVEWLWQSGLHSSTSGTCNATNCIPDGMWNSGQLQPPSTFTFTFNTPGTYTYYCTVHTVMMQGLVNVLPLTPTPGRPVRR